MVLLCLRRLGVTASPTKQSEASHESKHENHRHRDQNQSQPAVVFALFRATHGQAN